jgi:hypothetical protein
MRVANFTTYNGVAANRIIRLKRLVEVRIRDFDNSTGFDTTVNAFQLDNNGKLYVGGSFHHLQRCNCKLYHPP